MLKYCVDKWDKNKEELRKALADDANLNECDYLHLVKMVVRHILNDGVVDPYMGFDDENIVVVDHGSYQGCQLFVIPEKTYQPASWEYLIACQEYGSCTGCDTLKAIQDYETGHATKSQLKDYMTLCKDIVCSIVHPFDGGLQDERWEKCRI